jgi:hypothetical protein
MMLVGIVVKAAAIVDDDSEVREIAIMSLSTDGLVMAIMYTWRDMV